MLLEDAVKERKEWASLGPRPIRPYGMELASWSLVFLKLGTLKMAIMEMCPKPFPLFVGTRRRWLGEDRELLFEANSVLVSPWIPDSQRLWRTVRPSFHGYVSSWSPCCAERAVMDLRFRRRLIQQWDQYSWIENRKTAETTFST